MEGNVRRFVGIDLALVRTGLAVLDAGKMCLFPVNSDKLDNAVIRQFWILDRILRFVRQGDIVVVEDFAMVGKFANSGKSTDRIELLGMLRYALMKTSGCVMLTVHPSRLKKFVTGKGNAAKDDVIRELARRWCVVTTDHNLADAAGLALMGYYLVNGADSELEIDDFSVKPLEKSAISALEKEREANRRWLHLIEKRLRKEAKTQ